MVNQIILDAHYPTQAKISILHENAVLHSDDHGKTWAVLLEGEIACLAALPEGTAEQPLLVGLVDGSVEEFNLALEYP